jgi:hypothetical protein
LNQPSPGDRHSEDVPPDSKIEKKGSEGGEGHPEGKSAVHFTDEKIATINVTENENRKELPEEEVVSGVWGLVSRLPLFRSRKAERERAVGVRVRIRCRVVLGRVFFFMTTTSGILSCRWFWCF